jgi:internalin A
VIAHVGTRAGINALYWRDGVSVYEVTTHSRAIVEQEKDGEWGGTLRLRTQGPQATALLERLEKLVAESQQRIGLTPVETTRSLPERAAKIIEKLEPRHAEEPKPPELKFGEPPSGRTEWYVSYAWGDATTEGRKREDIVDRLCEAADRRGIRIERDKRAMSLGDSITKFMARIGDGDRVFVILSEKYLKSPYCMTELHEIWRTSRAEPERFLKRVRVFTLADAKCWTPHDRILWAAHWKTEHNNIATQLKELGVDTIGERDFRAFKLMDGFRHHVGDILATMADIVQPRTFEDFLKYGFDDPPLH